MLDPLVIRWGGAVASSDGALCCSGVVGGVHWLHQAGHSGAVSLSGNAVQCSAVASLGRAAQCSGFVGWNGMLRRVGQSGVMA